MSGSFLCLQCLSAGGALMPLAIWRGDGRLEGRSPMPFGWGGFDATGIVEAKPYPLKSPMPFGWGGFDAATVFAGTANHSFVSPMPFGWGGFDASTLQLRHDLRGDLSPMPFGWGGFDAIFPN